MTEPVPAGPLTGLRVLDISTVLAGPLTCQVFGDFGADVIKVEHPRTGDSFRTHGAQKAGHGLWWKIVARNKRCVAIDLSHPDGAAVVIELARTADVLVENFRPGTLERWGLGVDGASATERCSFSAPINTVLSLIARNEPEGSKTRLELVMRARGCVAEGGIRRSVTLTWTHMR